MIRYRIIEIRACIGVTYYAIVTPDYATIIETFDHRWQAEARLAEITKHAEGTP